MTRFDGWFYQLNDFSLRKAGSASKVNISANLFNHLIPLFSCFHEENHRKVSSLISQVDISKRSGSRHAVVVLICWFVTRALIGQTRLPETDFSPEYTNQIAPFKLGRVNRTFVPSINIMAIRTAFRRRRLFWKATNSCCFRKAKIREVKTRWNIEIGRKGLADL